MLLTYPDTPANVARIRPDRRFVPTESEIRLRIKRVFRAA
ncbi:MAG: hypothetical protein QOG85_1539 [Gaiellaceae bacterium]|jgi:hypothetical protein|nr:hypothetical protein [Gaiellaceae bacterium]